MPEVIDRWLQEHEDLVGWGLLLYQLLFAAIMVVIIAAIAYRVIA